MFSYTESEGCSYEFLPDLSKMSSMGCGGRAYLAISPQSGDALCAVISRLHSSGRRYRVVGNMTNILPPDGIYTGVIVRTDLLTAIECRDNEITVSCGCPVPYLVRVAAERGLADFSPVCGIPGTVGGFVYSNCGSFGGSCADYLLRATIYSADEGKTFVMSAADMDFSYRYSALHAGGLYLLDATFRAEGCDPAATLTRIAAINRKRRESQPQGRSLGSVFLRNGGVIPARLIDAAGLRGVRIGGAVVSEKHAGFIINDGGATSSDVARLIEYIRAEVSRLYGVTLNTEIEILP